MRNPKVVVTGATSEQMIQIKELLASKNIDLVDLPEEADATVDASWVLDERVVGIKSIPYEKLMVEIPEIKECCIDSCNDQSENQWRGGSRGKGGKIKYARR